MASATVGQPSGSVASAVVSQVRATIDELLPGVNSTDRLLYERAAAQFPSFCQNWSRLLHDREVDNLSHLSWQERGGYETANYTGYGKIESCECKESKEGLPIAKVRYEELDYYLVGKTIEEAMRAAPKLEGTVKTLEIFSWDKNKWFY